MKITETYQKNIKELDKFLKTLSFSEASDTRIREFVNNPLSVLNDDIKALFEKYDDRIVDYRLELPASMMKREKKYPKEIYLVLNTVADCLSYDNIVKFTPEANNPTTNITLSANTIASNYFLINNDKRKVWKYLDSKAVDIAKRCISSALANGKDTVEINDNAYGFSGYFFSMDEYVKSLGTRKTALREKISDVYKKAVIKITVDTNVVIKECSEVFKIIFKIMSEIVGAKLIDTDKFKMYLSFNAFDWLFASTGETFHSCIDMNSSYSYGIGLLGMCACPDWGMLLYTDDTKKTCYGIEALHIITRSWVCYTEHNEFQVVNWYPKDVRDSTGIEDAPIEGLKFKTHKCDGENSKSSWKPITFCNGGVAWIYSDLNEFIVDDNQTDVHFNMSGRTGINTLELKDGKLVHNSNANSRVIESINRSGYHSIGDAVEHGFKVSDGRGVIKEELNYVTCDCCNSRFESEDELTYIASEDIYVCSSCLENEFFYCEGCDEYHRLDDACEVFYGNESWEYDLRCSDCVANSGCIYFDEYEEKYFYDDITRYYIYYGTAEDEGMSVSKYSYNLLAEKGKAFMWSNGTYHDCEEPIK